MYSYIYIHVYPFIVEATGSVMMKCRLYIRIIDLMYYKRDDILSLTFKSLRTEKWLKKMVDDIIKVCLIDMYMHICVCSYICVHI